MSVAPMNPPAMRQKGAKFVNLPLPSEAFGGVACAPIRVSPEVAPVQPWGHIRAITFHQPQPSIRFGRSEMHDPAPRCRYAQSTFWARAHPCKVNNVAALSPKYEVVEVGHRQGTFGADLSDADSVRNVFKAIGKVDAITSTAGAAKLGPLEKLTDDDFRYSLTNKLMGEVNLARIVCNPQW